jgi:hypothetical protein
VSSPALPDKVVAVDRALEHARIQHAFGGALALAYYAEPRATIDIDVNVFAEPARHVAVAQALEPLGVTAGGDPKRITRDGQCRWWWDRTPLDLFFTYDELHEAMAKAVRRVPFGEDRIPILAPEHLAACKALYDRPKDWLDIEQMLVTADEIDLAETRDWLIRTAGESDPRLVRFEQLASRK